MLSNINPFIRKILLSGVIFITLLFPIIPVHARSNEITGWFSVIWGDGAPGSNTSPTSVLLLTDDNGQSTRIQLDETELEAAGGILTFNRRRVAIKGTWAPLHPTLSLPAVFQAESITLADSPEPKTGNAPNLSAITGSQPWITVMCKFQDYSAEPKDLAYFQNMYGGTYPGLDHYWREVSYNLINIVGSNAVGWFTLPHPRSYYLPDNQLNHTLIAQDCAGAADAAVNFHDFVGINLMFNTDLDGYAWGGFECLDLDGSLDCWNMTWEPPWGYSAITVMSHEMGHGFGLPHSSGAYGYTYDNRWDVMSDTWTDCSRSSDVTYGCLGQHTISFHKDYLGWVSQKYIVANGTSATVTVDRLDQPPTGNYQMAQIPIQGSSFHFYTVEVRQQTSTSYDKKLPGQGVIIHEVDLTRTRPAYVMDADNNGDTGDAGAIWTAGETFTDLANGITIEILSSTSSGYQIRGTNTAPVVTFTDVPASYWAHSWIERLYSAGITGGCATNPLMYCPESSVTRAEMAIFLERGMKGTSYSPPAAQGSVFGDVPVAHWAASWIEQLASDGITGGCGNNNYCPESSVTRAQMAVFLLKARHGTGYNPPASSGIMFNDVSPSHWAAAWIEQLANEGITSGCGNGAYCPDSSVTRAQMAVFLVRAFNLP